VTVMYDEKRGEPRKSPSVSRDKQGDCVGCNRCVQVCPTGIDIRQGIQMECIGCTACIDACDEIMHKVKKPEGLIRYKTLTEKKIRWFRPRVLTYGVLLLGSIAGLALALGLHSDLRVEFLRGKDIPFQTIEKPDGSWVQNHFVLRVENDGQEPIKVKVEQLPGVEIVLPENPIALEVRGKKDLPLIVAAPFHKFTSHGKLDVDVVLSYGKHLKTRTLPLLGPYRIEK
jgi:cytochrome c oxidase accessory protein FixG